MSENKSFLNAMAVLGLLLAIGMASAAFILGVQAKRAVSGQQSITVKVWQKSRLKQIAQNGRLRLVLSIIRRQAH